MHSSFMGDHNLVPIFPAIVILLLLSCVYLANCYSRTRALPQCCKCGARKVRRSQFHGFADTLAAIVLLSPYRCSGCRARFYALRTARGFL